MEVKEAESEEKSLNALVFAIKAQKEVKEQLTAEILELKKEFGSENMDIANAAKIKFYSSSLNKILSETSMLNNQFLRVKTIEIPEANIKRDSLLHRQKTIENRSKELKEYQDAKIMNQAKEFAEKNDKENAMKFFNDLMGDMEKRIQEYDRKIEENTSNANKLRENLREIQKTQTGIRRDDAVKVWQDEMADEKRVNLSNFQRRQSCFGLNKRPQIPLQSNLMARRYSTIPRSKFKMAADKEFLPSNLFQ